MERIPRISGKAYPEVQQGDQVLLTLFKTSCRSQYGASTERYCAIRLQTEHKLPLHFLKQCLVLAIIDYLGNNLPLHVVCTQASAKRATA
jgi:hypothetical protein